MRIGARKTVAPIAIFALGDTSVRNSSIEVGLMKMGRAARDDLGEGHFSYT